MSRGLGLGERSALRNTTKALFLANGDESKDPNPNTVLADDIDGATLKNTRLVSDVTEDGQVYCISA